MGLQSESQDRTPAAICARLDVADARKRRLDNAISVLWIGLCILAVGLSVWGALTLVQQFRATPVGSAVGVSSLAPVLIGPLLGFVALVLHRMQPYITSRFAPTWEIEEREEAVLVWGTIPGVVYDRVFFDILSRRPGYGHHQRPWETFGSSLAAVPAEPGYVAPAEPFVAALAEDWEIEVTDLGRRAPM